MGRVEEVRDELLSLGNKAPEPVQVEVLDWGERWIIARLPDGSYVRYEGVTLQSTTIQDSKAPDIRQALARARDMIHRNSMAPEPVRPVVLMCVLCGAVYQGETASYRATASEATAEGWAVWPDSGPHTWCPRCFEYTKTMAQLDRLAPRSLDHGGATTPPTEA